MLPGTVLALFSMVYLLLFAGSAIWVGLTRDCTIWYYRFYHTAGVALWIIVSVAIVIFY
jgi:hypothetical protein